MSSYHGRFVWYELMTTDAAAAEGFYRDVVGWRARDSGMPDMAYTLFLAAEDQVAGMMTLSEEACAEGARPAWIGYIGVDDVDAYAARVGEAGGKVHRPPDDIPGIGRFAIVADPQGAAFVLFKGAGAAQPPVGPDRIGGIRWHQLSASDAGAAFDFYAGLFGWTKGEAFEMEPGNYYQLFAVDGRPIGGMETKPPAVPVPHWTFFFRVDGIAAAMDRVRSGGGTVTSGPHEVPTGGWIAHARDPQGATFALFSATS